MTLFGPLSMHICIADLYFFEELHNTVGFDASREWLIQQQIKTSSCSEDTASESLRFPSVSTARSGRNAPCAKHDANCLKHKSMGDRDLRELKIGTTADSNDHNPDANHPKQGKGSPLQSTLSNFATSLGLESSEMMIDRTLSVERKFGLLFTDAAHTILD